MKVLLINQNPVIKKLVSIASKKLNLEVENIARIPSDFIADNYICIIVDDENVGKNLERLTALQDHIKVCLLFSRKTQIKKHEFNIAIQKPFLPTDILEILHDCIPHDDHTAHKNSKSEHTNIDYDSIDKVNEIDMDLRSAEIELPDGIDISNIHDEKDKQETNDDNLDNFDFDPESLNFSALEEAGEVMTQQDTNIRAETPQNADSTDQIEYKNGDSDNSDITKRDIFDNDLSDLKPSSQDALDLANFDLDSIVDSSALKAASLGSSTQIDKEAQEVANNLSDDDLFLSNNEQEILQPRIQASGLSQIPSEQDIDESPNQELNTPDATITTEDNEKTIDAPSDIDTLQSNIVNENQEVTISELDTQNIDDHTHTSSQADIKQESQHNIQNKHNEDIHLDEDKIDELNVSHEIANNNTTLESQSDSMTTLFDKNLDNIADINMEDIEEYGDSTDNLAGSQDSTTHDLDSIDKDVDLDNLELSQDNELSQDDSVIKMIV